MFNPTARSTSKDDGRILPPGVWHVVTTRFSCMGNSFDPKKRNLCPDDSEINHHMLRPQAIECRFTLFEMCSLPSLRSQINRNFDLLIIVSKHLSEKYRLRIRNLVGQNVRLHVHEFSQGDDLGKCSWLAKYAPQGTKYIITTNLDDDDALPSHFIQVLQSKVAEHIDDLPPMMTFGSKSTLQWDLISTRRAALGYRVDSIGNWVRSAGISLFTRLEHSSPTVYAMDHTLGDIWFEKGDGEELLQRLSRKLGPTVSAKMLKIMEALIYEFRREWGQVLDQAFEWEHRHNGCLYFELGHAAGPTVMTNHIINDTPRLFLEKRGKIPVLGPESFPNTVLHFDTFRDNSEIFKKRWPAYLTVWRQSVRMDRYLTKASLLSRAYVGLRNTWRFARL